MRRKARLSKFLVERIHRGWIDRLYPQGWEMEKDPYPTTLGIDIISKSNSLRSEERRVGKELVFPYLIDANGKSYTIILQQFLDRKSVV